MYVFVAFLAYFKNYLKFSQKHVFCNFRKILMISVVLGLQFVPQVFNIFEKRILSAHERLGDQQKIIFWVDYNDSCENVSEVV